MDAKKRWKAIIEHFKKDPFAEHLGARLEIVSPGHSRVYLTVKENMTNFHGTTHGGIIFTVSDIAFAAACNSHGRVAVALNISISFIKPSYSGDRLMAEAKEVHNGRKTSLYDIRVVNETTGELIAKSQDQAYRLNDRFVPDSDTP